MTSVVLSLLHSSRFLVRSRAALPVGLAAAVHAHLYLWRSNAFIETAHRVARVWGFEPRTILTWVKPGLGMGQFFRNNTEHVDRREIHATASAPVTNVAPVFPTAAAPIHR